MWKRVLLVASLVVALVACNASQPSAPPAMPGAPIEVIPGTPTPEEGARTVAIDTAVAATFSVEIDEDSLEGNFTLAKAGGSDVAGEVAYDADSRTATFTPNDPLAYATVYVAMLSGSIKAINGARLGVDKEWDFGTIADPGPAPAVTNVEIVGGNRSMVAGTSTTLTANVTAYVGASQAVTWSSSNTFATVTPAGVVTAVAAGSAEITATSDFNNSQTDTITITISPPAPDVTSVTIDGGDLTLIEGDTITLEATVVAIGSAPTSVTWESSDTNTATIDPTSGELTAIAAGTTTITATSTFEGGLSDSIEVTVNEPEPAVTSVTIDRDDLTLYLPFGPRRATLTATVEAVGGASEGVIWSSSNTRVATVGRTTGRVSAKRIGTAIITATSAFDDTMTASITVTVRSSF